MTVRYLDHAARVATPIGMQHFSPGLIDIDAYPQVAPHIGDTTSWERPKQPEFKLKRHCAACESQLFVLST